MKGRLLSNVAIHQSLSSIKYFFFIKGRLVVVVVFVFVVVIIVISLSLALGTLEISGLPSPTASLPAGCWWPFCTSPGSSSPGVWLSPCQTGVHLSSWPSSSSWDSCISSPPDLSHYHVMTSLCLARHCIQYRPIVGQDSHTKDIRHYNNT